MSLAAFLAGVLVYFVGYMIASALKWDINGTFFLGALFGTIAWVLQDAIDGDR